MKPQSRFDVIRDLYLEVERVTVCIMDSEKESNSTEDIERLYEQTFICNHLNYIAIKALRKCDESLIREELEFRSIDYTTFMDKVTKMENEAVRFIVWQGLLEEFGVTLKQLAPITKIGLFVWGPNANRHSFNAIGHFKPEQNVEIRAAAVIDVENNKPSIRQQTIIDESHRKFIESYISPFISGDNSLNGEEIVNLINLDKLKRLGG